MIWYFRTKPQKEHSREQVLGGNPGGENSRHEGNLEGDISGPVPEFAEKSIASAATFCAQPAGEELRCDSHGIAFHLS